MTAHSDWLKAFFGGPHKAVFLKTWLRQVARYGYRNLRSDEVIVVCQFGKVGSSSMQASLESLDLKAPVYHTHGVSGYDMNRIQSTIMGSTNPRRKTEKIVERIYLRSVLSRRFFRCHLITLVREPVAVLVSAFFQLQGRQIWKDYSSGETTLPEIQERFLRWQEGYRNWFDHWFDRELLPYLGTDIFETPFPTATGYSIYACGAVRLVIIRLEDLGRCHQEAFRKFLGLKDLTLRPANVGAAKEYGEIYRKFVAGCELPGSFLDQAYDLRYARHFYSRGERDEYRACWGGSSKLTSAGGFTAGSDC